MIRVKFSDDLERKEDPLVLIKACVFLVVSLPLSSHRE